MGAVYEADTQSAAINRSAYSPAICVERTESEMLPGLILGHTQALLGS